MQDFFMLIFERVVSWSENDGFFAFLIIALAPVSIFFYLRGERIKWNRVFYVNILFMLYFIGAILITGLVQLIWFNLILKDLDSLLFNHLKYSAPTPFPLYWTLSMFVHLILGNTIIARGLLQVKRKEERLIDNE